MRKKEKKKHKILVHGWLSATLALLFHACLLALPPSGRHGRTAAAVCTCCCCHYGVAVLRLVVVLLLLLPLCTKKLRKHARRENENTGVQKSVESKEKLERSSK